MAIYHCSAKVIGRSAGRSSTAAAAYRAGERIQDQRTGEEHDYTRRGGVEHREITAPEGAPSWAFDRAQLWNAVELAEARRDAQLAREFTVALPHELGPDERAELVREWVQDELAAKGMVADWAVHEPSREGDERNYHAHVMATMRPIEGETFGKKNREWNSREQLEEWRSSWAESCNQALDRAGREERVDHRSLAEQRNEAWDRGDVARMAALEREPTRHLGPAATAIERKGAELTREDLTHGRAAGEGRSSGEEDQHAPRRDSEARSESGGAGDPAADHASAMRELAERVERAAERLVEVVGRGVEQLKATAREMAARTVAALRERSTGARQVAERARNEITREPQTRSEPGPKRDGPDRDDGGRSR